MTRIKIGAPATNSIPEIKLECLPTAIHLPATDRSASPVDPAAPLRAFPKSIDRFICQGDVSHSGKGRKKKPEKMSDLWKAILHLHAL
ncbi:hypothetical protein CDAR_95131 [Caerostris darwini]|uniref:Uncharacterized protein n=1 Tax=Caerostris darwini TaxID=1538125 RepID=A0AAV4PIW7_9ARAC|nr:hypothetical protein CDAR_95131 [Caerostris darwini]